MKKWIIRQDQTKVEQNRRHKKSRFHWFYKSKSWKVARNKVLQINPICEICEQKGIIKKATTVNHINPLRLIIKSGATAINEMSWSELKKATDQNNLECLCLECHGIEESEMIKRENAQKKIQEEKKKQESRENAQKKIQEEKRNNNKRDKFKHKIYTDSNGNDVYMDIY